MERKSITEIRRGSSLISGSEANIFNTEYGLYKEFHPNIRKETILNKEEKLKNLEKNIQLQQYYPQIYYLIDSILKDYIRGFIMQPITGQRLNTIVAFEIKKELLQKIRDILYRFRESGYLYLDIRLPNIKIDKNNTPFLLDIDSICYLENPILDAIPTNIKKYRNNGGKIDEHAQIAMFNQLTTESFTQDEYDYDKIGEKIIKDMNEHKPDSYYDNEYLLNYIKRR